MAETLKLQNKVNSFFGKISEGLEKPFKGLMSGVTTLFSQFFVTPDGSLTLVNEAALKAALEIEQQKEIALKVEQQKMAINFINNTPVSRLSLLGPDHLADIFNKIMDPVKEKADLVLPEDMFQAVSKIFYALPIAQGWIDHGNALKEAVMKDEQLEAIRQDLLVCKYGGDDLNAKRVEMVEQYYKRYCAVHNEILAKDNPLAKGQMDATGKLVVDDKMVSKGANAVAYMRSLTIALRYSNVTNKDLAQLIFDDLPHEHLHILQFKLMRAYLEENIKQGHPLESAARTLVLMDKNIDKVDFFHNNQESKNPNHESNHYVQNPFEKPVHHFKVSTFGEEYDPTARVQRLVAPIEGIKILSAQLEELEKQPNPDRKKISTLSVRIEEKRKHEQEVRHKKYQEKQSEKRIFSSNPSKAKCELARHFVEVKTFRADIKKLKADKDTCADGIQKIAKGLQAKADHFLN